MPSYMRLAIYEVSTYVCWYTNADTPTNKLPELSSRVKNAKTPPSMIAITEIKPKNYRYPLTAAELQLDNCDIFTKNIPGNKERDIAIYTTRELKAHEISIKTIFEEHLTVCIKLENDEELTITCIYRSPSSTPENNNALCRLIKEIDGRPEQLKIISGDFNYPSITWSNLYYSTSDNNENKDPDNLKEAIIEMYLQPFMDFPTRARGSDNPSCIDWVFSNNETIINRVMDISPLGGSDHTIIETDINVTPKDSSTHYKKILLRQRRRRRDARLRIEKDGGDTRHKRQWWPVDLAHRNTDRSQRHPHTEQEHHRQHEKETPQRPLWPEHHHQKKHKCWQRYMETRSGDEYKEFRRLSNQVKNHTKKAKKKMEREIAKESKTNPKKFWQYVKKKKK